MTATFLEQLERLEALLLDAERQLPAPALAVTRQVVGAVLDAHRSGLGTLLERLTRDEAGKRLLSDAAQDRAVATLLVLHGLHPEALGVRVRRALAEADVAVGKTGFVELRGSSESEAHVLIKARTAAASGHVRALVESSFNALAPEVDVVFEVELLPGEAPTGSLIPLERLRSGREARR